MTPDPHEFHVFPGGMGYAGMPPGHPSHSWHCRNRCREALSLELGAARGCAAARRLLDAWIPGEHPDPEWVASVLRYFRHVYEPGELRAEDDPNHPDHMGGRAIRRWWPTWRHE